jgi:hypothetical protein
MATNLRANGWYNGGQPYGLAGYINDFSSRMIGYGWVRQVRVQNNSCIVNNRFSIDFCDADSSVWNGDNKNYGFGWSTYNESYVPNNGMQQIYNAFQYQDSNQLQGY